MKEDCYITIQLMADNEEIPMFQQVADGLIAHIRSGILRPLDKLPASRVLALKLGVSRKTIVKATEQLLL